MKNKLKLLSVFFLVGICSGQDIRDVLNIQSLAATTNTLAVSVTATQGDGTVCKLTKVSVASIALLISCASSDGKITLGTATVRATGTSTPILPVGQGDVVCLVVVNPTTAAVPFGSLGSVPANSVAWTCSTNIRTAGAISGQTVPVNGSVSWP
jgi:hypothetical protein